MDIFKLLRPKCRQYKINKTFKLLFARLISKHLVFKILQYNINKSKDKIIISLFENFLTPIYNILAIQKLWKNLFQHTINHWLVHYFEFSYYLLKDMHIYFFIYKRLALFSQLATIYSTDFSTLEIKTKNKYIIHIYNVYNPCQTSGSLSRLGKIQKFFIKDQKQCKIYFFSENFNLHHFL